MSNRDDLNQVETYMHPKYFKMFVADCFARISGKADNLERIIKAFLDARKKD